MLTAESEEQDESSRRHESDGITRKENKNIFNVDHKLDDSKDFSQFLLRYKLKKLLCFLGLKKKKAKFEFFLWILCCIYLKGMIRLVYGDIV